MKHGSVLAMHLKKAKMRFAGTQRKSNYIAEMFSFRAPVLI